MAEGQSEPPFSQAGPCAVTENDEETGTPSTTDYDERADHPAPLGGAEGGAAFHQNRGEVGSSKADPPAMLVWEGVTYRIAGKTLLHTVSGAMRKGEMVALMGLSGSGKTTLLNCLSRHIMPQEGRVQVFAERGRLPSTVGYVADASNFFDKVTMRDTLLYKARLAMPETSDADIGAQVDALMGKLSMTSAQHTQVCSLSAGEMKRLSAATQLLRKPDILILDEPLSGLDSANSLHLARFLKTLTLDGVSVLMSLHQPRPEVFNIMDVVGLLHHGRMVYWGDRDAALSFLDRSQDVQQMSPWFTEDNGQGSPQRLVEPAKLDGAVINPLASWRTLNSFTRADSQKAQEAATAGDNADFIPYCRKPSVEPAHRVLDILSSLSGVSADEESEAAAAIATRFAASTGGKSLAAYIKGGTSSLEDYRGPASVSGLFWRRLVAGLKISARQVIGNAPTLVLVSALMLALFALTTTGFGNAAGSGAGLALALWVVASHTAYNISSYNVTGFSSYLFVPYHDVLEGTLSVRVFMSLVVVASLFHTALVTVMSLSMFYTMEIGGPPLMLPTFVAGVSLWVFGVFGFIALIMGLETLFNSCRTRNVFHTSEQKFCLQQHPAYFMFVGLYLLYSGIILAYDNIPAGFRWIYYTNPATWFTKAMLTLFVCDGTSCDTGGAVVDTEFPAEGISAILNIDKAYIGALVGDGDAEVDLVGAGGGGSYSILSGAGDQAIISQFDLESGSVASFLGAALVTAVAPFVAAYMFLVLHQAWLRQRGSLKGRRGCRGARMSSAARWLWLVVLAGAAVAAFVVSLPFLAFGDGESEILPEFEEDLTSACPGCINGIVTAGYLDATPVTFASRLVRATLMTQSVRAALTTIPRKEHLFVAGSTDMSNTTSFVPSEVSDFLEVTPRLGQDLSDEFVNLTHAEGKLFKAIFESGNALFINMKTLPDEHDFPVSSSEDLANLMADVHNTTLGEALAEGRLYSRREMKGLGDLEGRSISEDEDYVTMDARVLLYRNDAGDLETLALQLGEGFPLLVEGTMDGNCWTIAKALGRNSIIFQGVVEHLGKTHLTGWGVFHVSTEKNLAVDHPVRRFLDPHLHPSGFIDNILTISAPNGYVPFKEPLAERMLPLYEAIGEEFNWTEQANLHTYLELAGLGDVDDGLDLSVRPHLFLMHDAARAYAGAIVNLSYDDDVAVADDDTLQAFALDLCSEDAGNIQGLCWGGGTVYGRGQGYPDEPPIASRQELTEILGDALSGIFLGHNIAHSRALIGTLFVPFCPISVRPNFVPNPTSVCTSQDVMDAFGDHNDWARQIFFFSNVLSPSGGHVTQFRGHYDGAPLADEKNAVFDTFIDTLEGPITASDAESGLGVWEQLGSYIYA